MTPRSALLDDPTHRRELRQQHSDGRSQQFLADLGIAPTARCAEIGAGLGSMARWTATTLAPRGQVLATEARLSLVDAVQRPDLVNLKAVQHDVSAGPLPWDDLDLIYTRYVLEHVPGRSAVLAGLAGQLRPGGWLVVEDASFVESELTGPPEYRDAMSGFVRAKPSSDYRWADTLPQRLHASGLREISCRRVSDVFASGSLIAVFWASLLAQEAQACQELGTTTVTTVDRAVDILLNGSAWFTGPSVVQCAGRRVAHED